MDITWQPGSFLRENGHPTSFNEDTAADRRRGFSSSRYRQLAIAVLAESLRGHFDSLAEFAAAKASKEMQVWNTEHEGAISEALRDMRGFVASEYFGQSHTPGTFVKKNGKRVRHEDLKSTSFKNDTFDLILSSEVFEHVPNPYEAFKEVLRILKPGGKHIFTVPFFERNGKDTIFATLEEDGVFRWTGDEKPMHGDSVRPEGIPVFTIFGQELARKLCGLGFHVEVKVVENIPEAGILGEGSIYFVATKDR